MGALAGCGRAFLAIINIIVVIIGVVLLALGLFLRFGKDTVKNMLNINSILQSIPSLSEYESATSDTATLSSSAVDIDSILNAIAIPLVIVGAILSVFTFIGCLGGCCRYKILLIIYAVVIGILLLASIILVPMLLTHKLDEPIKSNMNQTFVMQYKDITDFSANSLPLNLMMLGLGCCGINNYTDFKYDSAWPHTFYLKTTIRGQTVKTPINQITPIACCKSVGTFPDITLKDTNCSITPTTVNSNFHSGCYDTMWAKANDYRGAMIGTFVGVIVLLALCFIVAVLLAATMDKNKVAPKAD